MLSPKPQDIVHPFSYLYTLDSHQLSELVLGLMGKVGHSLLIWCNMYETTI